MAELLKDGQPQWMFKQGVRDEEVTLDRLNAILDAIIQNNIVNVVNGTFVRTNDGITIVCDPKEKGSDLTHPLQPVKSGNTIKVRYGTVNLSPFGSVVPLINGVELTPDIDDDDAPFFTISESGFIYLVYDSTAISLPITIEFFTSTQPETNTKGFLLLSAVTFSNGAVTNFTDNISGSLNVAKCGGRYFWGRV